MRIRIQWLCTLLVLALVTAAVGAWQLRARDAMIQWDPIVARRANEPLPVRTVTVDERSVSETVGGTAVTLPTLSAEITLPVSSSNLVERQVATVNFRPGSTVAKGDVLLTFEPDLFEQTLQQRMAFLAKCQQEHASYVELAKSKAASAMQVREAALAVETAKLELALAKRDRELCDIASPIEGVVDELAVAPGTRVAGSSRLAVIHQLNPIYVEMDYPMERIDQLQLGQAGDVVLDAYSQEVFVGKVIRIAPVVSTKTRVLPVTLEVPNPDNRIKAGISGFVRIKTEKKGVTTVPSVAVVRKQQRAMVVCVENGKACIREVHTGSVTDAGDIEVLDGLKVGEEVVVHGQDALEENDDVNVDWRSWTRREIAAR
jgi:RND family efflux transporter MFP subunit